MSIDIYNQEAERAAQGLMREHADDLAEVPEEWHPVVANVIARAWIQGRIVGIRETMEKLA